MYVRASFSSLYKTQQEVDADQINRRFYEREDQHQLAELVIDLKGRKVACLIHNLSQSGAMVETTTTILPKHFILNYPTKDIRRTCRVVWAEDNLIGLEFV